MTSDIPAEKVRELREKSGAGFMDCKRALTATHGDLSQAIEFLRKEGVVKAAKKAGRVTLEGLVGVCTSPDRRLASLVEVNCETDFVARTDPFQEFVSFVAEKVVQNRSSDLSSALEGGLQESLSQLIARVGENMAVRRFRLVQAGAGEKIGFYLHAGAKIGVLVKLKGDKVDESLARDVAMHVAAMSPHYLSRGQVPPEILEKEKEILKSAPELAGKPPAIQEKILDGRFNRFYSEVCLLEQPFIKDPTGKKTVGEFLSERAPGASILEMARYQVGEEV